MTSRTVIPQPSRTLLWNAPEAVAFCAEEAVMRHLLRVSRLPLWREEEDLPVRRYKVLLCQTRVLKLWSAQVTPVWLNRWSGVAREPQFEEMPESVEQIEQKRIVWLASRALHALRLDYGLIELTALSENRLQIVKVTAEPALLQPWAAIIEQACREAEQAYRQAVSGNQEILMGADPEFALRGPYGKMGIASKYLQRNGTVGYDAARYREQTEWGQHPIVEIRPKPSADPNELFLEIYRAMKQVACKRLAPEWEWVAGGMPFDGYPIGGHIHFSGRPMTFSLIRKLDAYLALPLMLVEDAGCRKRRGKYGFLGDVREKQHGGFEYRTLPSWLVSPRMTKGTLALAKVIATCERELHWDPLLDVHTITAYYEGDKEQVLPVVEDIWSKLRQVSLYREYRHSLDPFFDELLSCREWAAERDIRLAWKLISTTSVPSGDSSGSHVL